MSVQKPTFFESEIADKDLKVMFFPQRRPSSPRNQPSPAHFLPVRRRSKASSGMEHSESIPLIRQLERPKKLSSNTKTLGNIVISIVGSGVLGLPYSFMKSGWLCGFISLIIVALITYYGMMLLVVSRKKLLEELQDETAISTYGELGYQVLGSPGQILSDVLIVIAQGGFCVAYLIFIGQNLSSLSTGGIEKKNLFIGIVGRENLEMQSVFFPSTVLTFLILNFSSYTNGLFLDEVTN